GIDEGAGDAAFGELINLIFHQRDERRNYQRNAVAHQGGQLIAERLAAACGHDDDRVAARQHRLDDFVLALAEFCEAKILLQRLARGCSLAHSGILTAVVAVVGCAGLLTTNKENHTTRMMTFSIYRQTVKVSVELIAI